MRSRWPGQPFLDVIRPDPGWQTDFAVLTTYSVDLVAAVAAMLALAGLDDDRGSGSRVDFATALDRLTDRWRVLCQAGRIGVPRGRKPVLAVLDNLLRPMRLDESTASWHAKIALVRYARQDPKDSSWRLWIGSRNLTRTNTWDAGLALASNPAGVSIPGVANLGRTLVGHAELPGISPNEVEDELTEVRWERPEGVDEIESIRLLGELGEKGLQDPPSTTADLLVMSPFLDGTTVKQMSRWGDTGATRRLVSTLPELARLHRQNLRPLDRFALLSLDAPLPYDTGARRSGDLEPEPDAVDADDANDIEEAETHRGLHAKLIMATHDQTSTLWLGSANATTRAWDGSNSEIVARMRISDNAARDLLSLIDGLAREVRAAELPDLDEADPEEQALDNARHEVAARWKVTQERTDTGPRLVAKNGPHPNKPDIVMEVAVLNQALTEWPRNQASIQLQRVPSEEESEIVHVRLRHDNLTCDWLEHAPLDPPPGRERDQRAIARYLGPRTFLLWVRSQLLGHDESDGGGDWDSSVPHDQQPSEQHSGPIWWAPTLEEILKAWARDPSVVRAIDARIRRYLEYVDADASEHLTEEERAAVREFRGTWDFVMTNLLGDRPR